MIVSLAGHVLYGHVDILSSLALRLFMCNYLLTAHRKVGIHMQLNKTKENNKLWGQEGIGGGVTQIGLEKASSHSFHIVSSEVGSGCPLDKKPPPHLSNVSASCGGECDTSLGKLLCEVNSASHYFLPHTCIYFLKIVPGLSSLFAEIS